MPIKSNSRQSSSNGENAIEDAVAGVSHEFQNFINDVENLIKETSSLSGEELEKAKAKLNERIASAREIVGKKSESLAKQARKSIDVGNKYVHQQPWPVIGASMAVGLLIGLSFVRRR